jgi:hypothetical protein
MLLKQIVCVAFNEQLSAKIATAESALVSAKSARDNETKSSAGDKYETGRELMQFEMDKQTGQLNQLKLLQGELAKINLKLPLQQAGFGSLIFTNQGNYLLSVSLGNVVLDNTSYYALSLVSPLGKMLLGKSVGDSFTFQGKEFVIQSLS